MSAMRLGLIALGAVFVLAVWIFNKWQERRIRRSIETPFAAPRRDVLLDREPGRGPAGTTGVPLGQRTEPRFVAPAIPGDGVGTAEEPGAHPHVESDEGDVTAVTLDESIHALIPLTLEQPVSGDRVLASLQSFRHAGRQSVSLLGWRNGAWYPIRVMERFERIMVAIQLANRSGPLNEVEFSEFVMRLEHAAEQIPATCDVPDMMETIARARGLDACCAPLDAQIGLTLANPQGVWSGDLLAREAQTLGLVLRSDGRFHAVLDDGTTLFALQNADGPAFRIDNLEKLTSARVTFLLDLPRAPEELEPYVLMTRAAQSMAENLSALIVDDQLRTLTPTMLEAIGRQIEPVYVKLDEAGLSAGSARALALFS